MSITMYGLLVTFQAEAELADLRRPFEEYAEGLNQQPGFISKAWLQDGNTLGGFHLFESKNAADAYLGSAQAAGLMATDGFDGFETSGFTVIDGLSALTGIAPVQQPA